MMHNFSLKLSIHLNLNIIKDMLKLTCSFYRFLPYTCEHISYKISHVKSFSHLYVKSKTCTSVFNQSTSFNPFTHNSPRQLGYKSKRFEIKKPVSKSNVDRTVKQMSESLQPTIQHVSRGGQFNVDSIDADPRIQLGRSGSMGNNHQRNDSKMDKNNIRKWESVGTRNNPNDRSFTFKVVSYNVLAQYLLESHPHLYAPCSQQDLEWQVRAARLYEQIVGLEPDILCLQEVQESHIQDFYSKFEAIGYCGVFKKRTGRSQDGCAIYFKRSMFYLEDQISPTLPLLNRDNVGLVVRLRAEAAGAPPLVVATAHLLYNPKRTDVRLAQTQLLLAEIDRFAYCRDGTRRGHYPIILTGDLNSKPNSAVVELLSKGFVSANQFRDNCDWRQLGVTDNCQHLAVHLNRPKGIDVGEGMIKIYNSEHSHTERGKWQEPMRAQEGSSGNEGGHESHGQLFNSGELSHDLRLSSVYTQRKPDGSREATTFQNCWVTVDYIYFSRCSALKLLKRLRLPTAEECAALGPLPNVACPSDHLLLAAIFELEMEANEQADYSRTL